MMVMTTTERSGSPPSQSASMQIVTVEFPMMRPDALYSSSYIRHPEVAQHALKGTAIVPPREEGGAARTLSFLYWEQPSVLVSANQPPLRIAGRWWAETGTLSEADKQHAASTFRGSADGKALLAVLQQMEALRRADAEFIKHLEYATIAGKSQVTALAGLKDALGTPELSQLPAVRQALRQTPYLQHRFAQRAAEASTDVEGGDPAQAAVIDAALPERAATPASPTAANGPVRTR